MTKWLTVNIALAICRIASVRVKFNIYKVSSSYSKYNITVLEFNSELRSAETVIEVKLISFYSEYIVVKASYKSFCVKFTKSLEVL
jgi:hypothetical protein